MEKQKSKYWRRRDDEDKEDRRLVRKQMANLDVFVCRMYQCVACRMFLTRRESKYFYRRPKVNTIVYAKGVKAVPVLCYTCMNTENFMMTWVKKWWDILPRPTLIWVHGDHKRNNKHRRLKPWEIGYGNDLYNTSQRILKAPAKQEYYGLFRDSDGVQGDRDSSG